MRATADRVAKCRRRWRAGVFACAALLCASGPAHAAARSVASAAVAPTTLKVAAAAPVAIASRVETEGETTRLVFDLSGPVSAQAFELANPDRLIVDLPEVNFQIEPDLGLPQRAKGRNAPARPLGGVIASYRFGLLAPGKSRIVVDLARPARAARVEAQALADPSGPSRLVIELQPVERAVFRAAAAENARRAAPAAAAGADNPARAVRGAKPVIVLDPGHGGVDTGAIGASRVVEKTVVFDFTRQLAEKLEASGRFQVMLTRRLDVFVSLNERVRIARAANAALFVSVHADMLHDVASVTGATVYTVSDRASDAEAARIAEQENQADAAAGHEADDTMGDVADILFDLTRRETRAYSHVFARSLVGRWRQSARINKNPQRSAGFRVLKAPDVPSVLLEIGYLSSPKDVEDLISPEWRDKTTTTVADAIIGFFSARAPDKVETKTVVDPMPTGALRPSVEPIAPPAAELEPFSP